MRASSVFNIATLIVAASAASRYEKRHNVDRPDPANLDHCPGMSVGDADTCTFESQSQGANTHVQYIIGAPVENCQGSTGPFTTAVGGSSTQSQTWEYGVTEGFSASGGEELPVGVSFENSDSWSNTNAVTLSQTITVTVNPAMKAAVVANVLSHTFFGRIRLNYGDPSGDPGANDYHYVWYNNGVGSVQPTDDIIYDQLIVPCNDASIYDDLSISHLNYYLYN